MLASHGTTSQPNTYGGQFGHSVGYGSGSHGSQHSVWPVPGTVGSPIPWEGQHHVGQSDTPVQIPVFWAPTAAMELLKFKEKDRSMAALYNEKVARDTLPRESHPGIHSIVIARIVHVDKIKEALHAEVYYQSIDHQLERRNSELEVRLSPDWGAHFVEKQRTYLVFPLRTKNTLPPPYEDFERDRLKVQGQFHYLDDPVIPHTPYGYEPRL